MVNILRTSCLEGAPIGGGLLEGTVGRLGGVSKVASMVASTSGVKVGAAGLVTILVSKLMLFVEEAILGLLL